MALSVSSHGLVDKLCKLESLSTENLSYCALQVPNELSFSNVTIV